jgi:5-dehydro-4-deoxyglucarate dehydratase
LPWGGGAVEPHALHGIWGFPVTPFRPNGELDSSALRNTVALQIEGGVDVVVALGALAEPASLRSEEWLSACKGILEAARRQVPVVVAVPPGLSRARAAAEAAAHHGASALLVLLGRGPQVSDLRTYLKALAAPRRLPLILYRRGSDLLDPDALRQLAEVEELIGIKDGQRDVRGIRRLREALPDRFLLAAAWEDLVLPYWAVGAHAFAPASTAHDPAYARAWFGHLERADVAAARDLLRGFAYPFSDFRLSRPGIEVTAVKAAMAARGLAGGRVRPPAQDLTSEEERVVKSLLRGLDRALGK